MLLTGATGSLGQVILDTLLNNEATIYSIGRAAPPTRSKQFIKCDLSKKRPEIPDLTWNQVIHCAGLAHVSEKSPNNTEKAFYEANVLATRNLLKSLEGLSAPPEHVVLISSVSVYGLHSGTAITEEQKTNPNTFYSKSKLIQEDDISVWCEERNVPYIIFRLPLVACPNPKGNLAKLAQSTSSKFQIRLGKISPSKSIVLASDVAQIVYDSYRANGTYNLSDQHDPTFSEITNALTTDTSTKIYIQVPAWICKFVALAFDFASMFLTNLPFNSKILKKATAPLTFDSSKATKELGWFPKSAVNEIPSFPSLAKNNIKRKPNFK